MESANHEFTWLSGRPQMSTSFIRRRESTSSSKLTDDDDDNYTTSGGITAIKPQITCGTETQLSAPKKPTPLPRHQRDADTIVRAKNGGSNSPPSTCGSGLKRPVPLPRVFQRPASSSSTSSLSDAGSTSSTPHYNVPPPPPPPPSSSSIFYVATPHSLTSSVVNKSVIFEFDPIMQRDKVDLVEERVEERLRNDRDVKTDYRETQTLSDDDVTDNPNVITESIERERLDSSAVTSNEFETDTMDDRSAAPLTNGQHTPSVLHPRSNSNAQSPQPQLRNKRATWGKHSPQLPPKSPVARIPKFGLSTVPPPPLPNQTAQQRPTASSSASIKTPIHVDNPCYMFVGATGEPRNCIESSGDESNDDDDESSFFRDCPDPPKFPPPPPPPPSLVPSSVAVVDDDFYTPPFASIVVDVNKCPPAPRVTRHVKCDGSGDETITPNKQKPVLAVAQLCWVAAADTTPSGTNDSSERCLEGTAPEKPKPKYPIYQNLLEIGGSKEGVYARIRKPANSASFYPNNLPPPLPPRGQQKSMTSGTTATIAVATETSSPTTDETKVENEAPKRGVHARSRQNEPLHELLRNIPHRGVLYRIGRGRKDVSQKWVLLERGHLQQFADDKCENPQEIFHHSDMINVARGPDAKHNNQELSCFEVTTNMCKERPHVFGAKYVSERDSWMQHICQSIAPSNTLTDTRGVVKAGYVKARKSISGVWQTFWLILADRTLCLWPTTDASCLELDLRKISSMQEYETDPQASMMTVVDGPLFVIQYPALTVYILSKIAFDTTDWLLRIRQASLQHGSSLEEQQLTHEDVPVIVDKCTKFVSTYGVSTKGIYRESGTSSKITRLLDNLRKDAWKLHIQQDEYSEHDVANALKRFLRTLPNALLMRSLYSQWIAAAGAPKVEAMNHYSRLLSQLPKINYATLKYLVAHLRSVSEQDKVNRMDVSNLAAVFGPTLMSTEGDVNVSNTSAEIDVISSLISNYPSLFGVSAEEIEKEERIQKALQELREARTAQKPAGDILVGIYVHDRQWGKCLNVKLSPSMAALDLIVYAIQQLRLRDRVDQLTIFEVVCDGEMERPLHHSEIVLAVTLRWASWSDTDARDSYLLIKNCDLIPRVLPLTRQPLNMFGELRFADIKSKSFRKYMFEFKNACLAYYKDAKISQPLGSWNIEDITWYIGCDCRRQAHTNWSITFIEQKAVVKRGTKETPYFGRTMCFSSEEELYMWMAAMLSGQYPNGIVPKLEPADLLT